MRRYLLFDSGCYRCTEIAQAVEQAAQGGLEARSLRDPAMQRLLDAARPGWRWEPTLLEIGDGQVRIFTGLAMGLRLMKALGPRRALRLTRLVSRLGVAPTSAWPVDLERRRFLQQLAAMVLLFGLPHSQSLSKTRSKLPAALCWYSWNGRGSWQSAPTGAGKCGTWNNSLYQAAWPVVTTYSLCDYSGCGQILLGRACGDSMIVTCRCNNASVGVTVADCGPNMRSYCSTAERCPPGGIVGYEPAIVDLTPAAFSAIADLALGTIPVTVKFQAICPSSTPISPGLPVSPEILPASPSDLFIQGQVLQRTREQLTIADGAERWIVRLQTDTPIWKGEEVTNNFIQIGDFIFARGWFFDEHQIIATRIWVNIVNMYGTVVASKPWGFELVSNWGNRLHVTFDSRTLIDEEPMHVLPELKPHHAVQVLGVRQAEGHIHATRLWILSSER